jgi:hypothetical protein
MAKSEYLVYSMLYTQRSHIKYVGWLINSLKVPNREIFLTELFTLSVPIWIGDLRTEPKNPYV